MEFSYSAKNKDAPVAIASFRAMNTVMEIVVVRIAEDDARRLCERARAMAVEIENRLSRHVVGSILSQINKQGADGFVVVDDDTYMVLELCEAMRRSTAEYFDIAALSAERQRPAYNTDPTNHSVRLASDAVILDVGGFAKGYALDRIKREFSDNGIGSALINFGNSSVTAIGSHPFGESWQVGLEVGSGSFDLRDSSLSVSGKSPSGGAHIVDPKRGEKIYRDEVVAVQGVSALVCEILSTALYVAPDSEKERIVANFEGYRYKKINTNGE